MVGIRLRLICALALAVGAAGTPVRAATFMQTLPVGNDPYGVAVDPLTHLVYVANRLDRSVSVIDPNSSPPYDTYVVYVGSDPRGIAVDPVNHRVYVTNAGPHPAGGGSVSVINTAPDPNVVIATVLVSAAPHGIAVVPPNPVACVACTRIYVTHTTNPGTVSVIDGFTNTVVGVPIPVDPYPFWVAVNECVPCTSPPFTPRVYVTHPLLGNGNPGNKVSVIDGSSNTLITTVTLPPGSYPYGVAADPLTDRVYVARAAQASVDVIAGPSGIQGTPNSVIATVPAVDPVGVAVDSVSQRVYAVNQTGKSVTEIDTLTPIPPYGTTTVGLPTPFVGPAPYMVATDPDLVNHRIYVTHPTSDSVSVLSYP